MKRVSKGALKGFPTRRSFILGLFVVAVESDSVTLRLYPSRLLCPWGCHVENITLLVSCLLIFPREESRRMFSLHLLTGVRCAKSDSPVKHILMLDVKTLEMLWSWKVLGHGGNTQPELRGPPPSMWRRPWLVGVEEVGAVGFEQIWMLTALCLVMKLQGWT